MKVKVGQWVRWYNTNINEITITHLEYKWHIEDSLVARYLREDSEHVIKVADTPQELIKVGDIIKLVYNEKLYHIEREYDMVGIPVNAVTKILTPNSKGGFNLQWEDKQC